MRASDAPTKSQKRRLEQQVWQDSIDSMSDNLATTLVVLNQYFGFGEQRLRKFLVGVTEVVEWYKSFKDDRIARDKLIELLKEIGIDSSEIYYKEDILLVTQQIKVEKRSAVSMKEAAEMQKKLSMMKQLQNIK